VHRNGFEVSEVAWGKGPADAAYRETAHDMTDQTAHTGQFCEHIQLTAEQGSFIHYSYPVGQAPVREELNVSLWVKANRPGIQLLARLALPRERNPDNLEEPRTVLLRGDQYQLVGRWQRLELPRPVKLAQQQQQYLRAEFRRDVDFTDAYIDRIVLNVYGGPGLTEVWLDDLEVGPVMDSSPFQTTSRPARIPGREPFTLPSRIRPRTAVVELSQDQLLVNNQRFFFRGIRHTDTPLKVLREAGFNTVWFDSASSGAALEEALSLGFWLVPGLPVTANDPRLASSDNLGREVARFLEKDAVLFWDLGAALTTEQGPSVARATQVVRAADPQRPLGADVWDGFRPFARNLDLLGVHRWPLMTGLELTQYREWLDQRRKLARTNPFLWTWVQTHLPDWFTTLVWGQTPVRGFQEPIGPQAEHIRLLTYTALSVGCRGLGFWSDRFLADSHQGRDRLLAVALLNLEVQMLEPLLLSVVEPPGWIETSVPEVKAAVLRSEKGVLVLPMWLGKGAQFVPGQSAAVNLTLVVPQVPVGTQAWEVSPGEVRSLRTERVVGGTRVTIPEFGLTAAVVFTADNGPNGLVVSFQDKVRRTRKLAGQWAHDLALAELEKVERVQAQLEQGGHTLPDARALLDNARARIKLCAEQWQSQLYSQAYAEAQRALRPVRILMRAQWEQATRDLDTAVASPYAVSFFTLPRHWQFWEQVRKAKPGANVLPEGSFEANPSQTPVAWVPQEATLDEVDTVARRVPDQAKEGRQSLMLQVKPKNPEHTPAALERTYLAINSPAVRLPPGTLVRISGWVLIPKPIMASADGALLYDSAGGEPLAVRLTEAKTWKKFTLYRRVPASGMVNVTMALTGLGTAYFDDIRIEPLVADGAPATTVLRPPNP
jgi:hypothetical protein